jgi:hypothetical protein
MGRHSAGDDEDVLPDPLPASALEGAHGRHESAEAGETAADRPHPEHGTRADLRLLRETPALRARCAAAVIVPFLLYTILMVVIHRVDAYLLWVWIPTVTAGVAVGTLLDLAHRRAR